jgi:hypothetical protein
MAPLDRNPRPRFWWPRGGPLQLSILLARVIQNVEPLEFHAGVVCGELPVGLCMMFVAMVLPSRDLSLKGLFVWNAAAQALARQNAEFGFGHVEPASMFGRVVPFEPLHEAARFDGREGRVQRGGRMCAQVVLDQRDLCGIGKMYLRQFLEHLRMVDRGVAVGDLDLAPALQRARTS